MSSTGSAAAKQSEFQTVTIEQLYESSTNPRRVFAKDALSDLTKSVAEKGVLVPLLVRLRLTGGVPATLDGQFTYEILAGARRFRAAKGAGLETVPVIVRDLDDIQALEVQVIENLQRQDVHPLEEAEGYKQLLERGKYEIADLAAKVGKSESYVYQRLKLAELVPAAKKAFQEEAITAGHAILIARLQPDQQKDALGWATDEYEKPSVRELADMIQRDILLDLHSASFPKDQADLVKGVPACVDCPKRTGFAPALFPDVKKKDTCTDPACFHKKAESFVRLTVSEAQANEKPLVQLSSEWSKPPAGTLSHDAWQDYEHKSAKCPSAEEAIVMDGHSQGKTLSICRDKNCKIHGREVRESGDGSGDKYRNERLRNEKKRRNAMELRRRILRAIAEQSVQPIEKLTLQHWQILASFVLNRMAHDSELLFANAMGIEPKTMKHSYGGTTKDFGAPIKARVFEGDAKKLVRWLLLIAVSPNLECANYSSSWPRESLDKLAKLEGVKVAPIEQKFKAELEAKKAKKPAKSQTSAKAKRAKAA